MKRRPLERKTGLSRDSSLLRSTTPTKRKAISPASPEQREKVRDRMCVSCGGGPCDPAHLIDRSLLGEGQEDPRAVVPLCRFCHRAYDEYSLSVLEALEPDWREELAFAVLRFGLIPTLRRVTGRRWMPEERVA